MKSVIIAGLFATGAFLAAPPDTRAEATITEQEAHAIGVDAYLYFYPLITMDLTRKQSTNIEAGKEFGKGPMNAFTNVAEYPPASFRTVVRPNFDTLYSVAWLDLTKEPVIMLFKTTWVAFGAKFAPGSVVPEPFQRFAQPCFCVGICLLLTYVRFLSLVQTTMR
jgi:Protein of unknown function (DUF1254)